MSTTLLHILQHALGRDEYGRPRHHLGDHRNHYCIGPGGDGFDLCRQAVADGLMNEWAPSDPSGGVHVFFVTALGKAYVDERSQRPPRKR